MPPKRGRKKKSAPKQEETAVISDDNDSNDEELKRVLEESKKDQSNPSEDVDLKTALELSMEIPEEKDVSNDTSASKSGAKKDQINNDDTKTSHNPRQRDIDENEDTKPAGSNEYKSKVTVPESSNTVTVGSSAAKSNDDDVDEFEQMAASSKSSLKDRINTSSILIDSGDEDSSPFCVRTAPSRPTSASVIIASDDDSVAIQPTSDSSFPLNSGEDASVRDTSRSGWLDVDMESGDTDDSEDENFNASLHRGSGTFRRRRRDSDDETEMGPAAERGEVLSAEEKNERMRSMFQSGLAIHFAGEEMQACRAVKTDLFPHQRVALAWMFKHENKESDGMLGGILADDMGLGKSLTVVALIMTNHWDGKPLCKPELGHQRIPFAEQRHKTNKGRPGSAAGVFTQKFTAKQLGVGSKLNIPKRKTIGGIFDKFKDDSSDSESEKENRKIFSFGKSLKKKAREDEEFINDDSSDLGSWEEDESSDDEFDKMSRKKNFFKSSKTAFKKEENPIDKSNLKEIDEEEESMSQEELMQSMIPTSLEETESRIDPTLNLDGLLDASSSDEDFQPQRKKRKKAAPIESDSEDEDAPGPSRGRGAKGRGKGQGKGRVKVQPARKKAEKKPLIDDDDSNLSLPSPEPVNVSPTRNGITEKDHRDENVRGEPSKNRNIPFTLTSRMNPETGLKMIIPPKIPAERGNRRRATLIVCPTSLISHWTEQLDNHLHESVNIKLKIHHGATKALTGADLESHDIVITTYGTLASEFSLVDTHSHSPLLRAKWLRVVLDEAHYIKNHNTKTAKAALNLDTIRRWAVTGTPIQNNLMEFWSLINWLNFGIYAGKSNMRYYKQDIVRPCKNGDPQGFERLQVLIDSVCLRRTKTDKKPDGSLLVELPKKTIIYREVDLGEDERKTYDCFLQKFREIVERYQRKGILLKNYAHVFAMMIRLRQLCCHRQIMKITENWDWDDFMRERDQMLHELDTMLNNEEKDKENGGGDLDENAKNLMKQLRDMIRSGITDDCSICLDDLRSPVITPCGHVYCRACIERVIATQKPPACPLCRKEVKKNQLLGKSDLSIVSIVFLRVLGKTQAFLEIFY